MTVSDKLFDETSDSTLFSKIIYYKIIALSRNFIVQGRPISLISLIRITEAFVNFERWRISSIFGKNRIKYLPLFLNSRLITTIRVNTLNIRLIFSAANRKIAVAKM